MTNKKFTDEQIIKALEHNASKCKFYEDGRDGGLFESTLDFIKRLKAENERLKAENKSIRYCYEQAKSYNNTLAESCEKNCKRFNMTTRAEAIKEFAERLKSEYEDEKQGYVNWFLKKVLPCKVGDDVVVLHAQYYDSDCKRMHYVMWHKEFKYSLLDEHKLGETLFFTEKEAIDFVHEHNGIVNKPTFQYLSKRIES